jgi:50S ribosomal subunit-associated GTPase HflX
LGIDQIPQLLVFNKEDQVEPLLAQTVCERYQAVSISAIQRQTLMKLILRVQEEILRLFPDDEVYPQLKPMREPKEIVQAAS